MSDDPFKKFHENYHLTMKSRTTIVDVVAEHFAQRVRCPTQGCSRNPLGECVYCRDADEVRPAQEES